MTISHLDHLVLTVRDMQATCDFYQRVLGMDVRTFGEGRVSLHYGNQKINLHQLGQEVMPNAQHAAPGTADLCFIVSTPIEQVHAHLQAQNVPLITDIVPRTGANGSIRSIYFCDPDGNLIELSAYEDDNA
ncbi:MAG: VOC family virulence protein [Anaerolineaceae bacterium]|nr:VOC family virulence protein [Anaerolineaceae bacterium]